MNISIDELEHIIVLAVARGCSKGAQPRVFNRMVEQVRRLLIRRVDVDELPGLNAGVEAELFFLKKENNLDETRAEEVRAMLRSV